ncbi:F0F1 ATP synthase subunit B [Candidatus Peregrinibacteria bacterium]|nr:F0F1 ATP synthase subunit B [Candidatus Peregrinibacteria bacterium]
MDLIDKLGIDPKLLVAQIVNFVILLLVLTKLVYKPLLKVLDDRKKMIAKSVDDGKKIEERLLALEDDRKKVISDAGREAMMIVEKAKKEAEEGRAKALENAKKEISAVAEKYRAQLQAEKADIFNQLKKEMAALVVASSEKILQREFSKDDQARLESAIKEEIKSVK